MNQDELISLTGLIVAIIALLISIVALVYTIFTYLLKSGHQVRGGYGTTSTIESDNDYISSVLLENLKDRSTVILKIYLKLSNNIYLLIEDFGDSPLILRPFEVYRKTYDPVVVYLEGMSSTQINELFKNKKITKQIHLSTTDGRYVVKTNLKIWDAVDDFFNNYFTAIIYPYRLHHQGKGYGDRIKYLVTFKFKGGIEEIIKIREDHTQNSPFKNFSLTEESLKSKDQLEKYIRLQKAKSKTNFEEIKVVSLQESVQDIQKEFSKNLILEPVGYLKYHILGKLYTIRENWKLKIQNKKSRGLHLKVKPRYRRNRKL
ncbi:hypothetical protein [Fibrella aquatica]|uniref:hypothetical protein n=1 Tax=Fibrella aquatica TaxID=3242487 RepID=UPI0035208FF5